MSRVIMIGFDGGPCSGKTIGMPRIAKALREMGYIALVAPEAATILIQGGITVEALGMHDFQKANYQLQAFEEQVFIENAKYLSEKEGKDAIILCDRAKLSGAAYLPEFFELLESEYHQTPEGIHADYAGIVHLVTVANGAEEFYTCGNNAARSEDIDGARALDQRSQDAWRGHPRHHVVGNLSEHGKKLTFEEKNDRALEAVLKIIHEYEKEHPSENTSTEEVECEAKALLTESEYLQLRAFLELDAVGPKKQVNSYFDTRKFALSSQGLMLRIREKEGVHELTLKENISEGKRKETNHRPLTIEERDTLYGSGVVPEGNVKDALVRLEMLQPFVYQGHLTTERIEIVYKGCKLALDHNTYLETSDHEIEMEKADKGADEHALLLDLLKECGIEYRPAPTKVQRFFQVKSEQ